MLNAIIEKTAKPFDTDIDSKLKRELEAKNKKS